MVRLLIILLFVGVILFIFIGIPLIVLKHKVWNKKEKTPTSMQYVSKNSNYSVADELLKWKKLKDEGVISDKEFEEMKKKLME